MLRPPMVHRREGQRWWLPLSRVWHDPAVALADVVALRCYSRHPGTRPRRRSTRPRAHSPTGYWLLATGYWLLETRMIGRVLATSRNVLLVQGLQLFSEK